MMDVSSSDVLYEDYMRDQPTIPVLAEHKRLYANNPGTLANRISLLNGGFGDFCFIPQILLSNAPYIRTTADKIIPFFEFPAEIQLLIIEKCVEPLRVRVEDNSIVVTLKEIFGRRCHPFRNGYQIEVPDHSGCSSSIYRHNYIRTLNEDEYEVIRALSQTSHQIRKLLQSVFWRDVYLNIGNRGYDLFHMLQDRPALRGSIKKLRMTWHCSGSGAYIPWTRWCNSTGWWCYEEIISLLQYISSQLELDELSVALSVKDRSRIENILTNDNISWVQAFRKMRFKKLKIDLWIEELMDPENYIDSEDDEYMHEYEDDYDSEDLDSGNFDPNDWRARNLAERRQRIAARKKWNEDNLAGLTEAVERRLRSTEIGKPGEIEKYLSSRATERES
ncbi:hypothetical protein ACMFMG_005930 [Clarireedia jacksonii]